ncbi:MAG TPA: bifunctional diaminohydroxyphosphoribosylaminopyrimidine deaminase/5-amino-6-(5-phosphoribosylamino)uracil reductase RibD [Cytophagaceae bacterium]|nr:bifunctional diaminohydroxyphosphoribosylaminopyrimidine deaminase/5-amino-6-(5-phosphoribosylamino)uracil reductase RibD [Cytophagaceae bacterium]
MNLDTHELYMLRALELALLGRGHVSPNPMVGCVIVQDGKIVGEGWHEKYGGPHAEVNAINSVQDKSKLEGATMYVTLEPCTHYGKTPPCADLILQYPIKKIVVCNIDPNPLVSGKGIEKLIAGGKEVAVGVLEEQGGDLNKRFFSFIEKKRPYILLKWAETSDGFIAHDNHDSKWISGDLSRKLVHKWRTEEDAIMVGTNTALYDNPRLNAREWEGRNPTRILIDKDLQVPEGAHLFDGTQTTICYNYKKQEVKNLVEYVKLDPAEDIMKHIIEDLYERKIQSVIVEGGAKLLTSIIKAGMWDEARIFRSKKEFGSGIEAPMVRGKLMSVDRIGEDEMMIYRK